MVVARYRMIGLVLGGISLTHSGMFGVSNRFAVLLRTGYELYTRIFPLGWLVVV